MPRVRSIEEGDTTTVFKFHVVCTDVLGDTSCLACDDICLADIVKQRCLTVVNVSHYGDDRGARNEVVLVVLGFGDGFPAPLRSHIRS